MAANKAPESVMQCKNSLYEIAGALGFICSNLPALPLRGPLPYTPTTLLSEYVNEAIMPLPGKPPSMNQLIPQLLVRIARNVPNVPNLTDEAVDALLEQVERLRLTLARAKKELPFLQGARGGVPSWRDAMWIDTVYQVLQLRCAKLRDLLAGAQVPADRLDNIVDADGKKFWAEEFGTQISVSWSLFYHRLYARYPPQQLQRVSELAIKRFINHTMDDIVTPSEFNYFVQWFGPMEECIDRAAQLEMQKYKSWRGRAFLMLTSFECSYYFGCISRRTAEYLLTTQQPAAFLVRWSPLQNFCFAVSYLKEDRSPVHSLIYVGADHRCSFTLQGGQPNHRSLQELMQQYAAGLQVSAMALLNQEERNIPPAQLLLPAKFTSVPMLAVEKPLTAAGVDSFAAKYAM